MCLLQLMSRLKALKQESKSLNSMKKWTYLIKTWYSKAFLVFSGLRAGTRWLWWRHLAAWSSWLRDNIPLQVTLDMNFTNKQCSKRSVGGETSRPFKKLWQAKQPTNGPSQPSVWQTGPQGSFTPNDYEEYCWQKMDKIFGSTIVCKAARLPHCYCL